MTGASGKHAPIAAAHVEVTLRDMLFPVAEWARSASAKPRTSLPG
jgi:hypothetical protein